MRALIGLVAGVVLTILISDGLQHVIGDITPPTILMRWILGTFAGTLAAGAISRSIWPGYVIATLMMAVAIFTIVQADHPFWLGIGGIAGPLVAAFIAARLTVHRR